MRRPGGEAGQPPGGKSSPPVELLAVALECETCGRLDELAVSTAETPDGTVCMTLCDVCEVTGVLPILGPSALSTRVVEHGEHLGAVGSP
jgi:hypothetical protein